MSYGPPDGGNLIVIYVPWDAAGACIDQFKASVTETDTTVVAEAVIHTPSDGDCSGVGTDGDTLGVAASLSAPLGNRSVVTADGKPLPRR